MPGRETAVIPSGPDPGQSRGGAWRTSFGITVSVIALGGCVIWALGQPAPTFPTSPRALGLLAVALTVYATSIALRGLRWGEILARSGIEVSPFEPYALTLVGYMGNTVLPLRGGEALRIVLVNERSRCGWKAAVGSVIPERLLDVLTVFLLLGLVVASGTITSSGIDVVAVVGGALVAGGVVSLLIYRRLRAAGRFEALADRIRPFAAATKVLLTPAGLWLELLTIVIWALEGAVFWLAAVALDLPISPTEGLALTVIATAFSTIPAGPAYAGTWDASLLIALRALGITGAAAISYTLMVRFVLFVPVTVVGLVVAITRYGGFGRLRGSSPAGRGLSPQPSSEGSPTAG